MLKPVKKEISWSCSICKRGFEKFENVRCHILRNRKCSASGAKAVNKNKVADDKLENAARAEAKK